MILRPSLLRARAAVRIRFQHACAGAGSPAPPRPRAAASSPPSPRRSHEARIAAGLAASTLLLASPFLYHFATGKLTLSSLWERVADAWAGVAQVGGEELLLLLPAWGSYAVEEGVGGGDVGGGGGSGGGGGAAAAAAATAPSARGATWGANVVPAQPSVAAASEKAKPVDAEEARLLREVARLEHEQALLRERLAQQDRQLRDAHEAHDKCAIT